MRKIAAGVAVVVLLIGVALWWKYKRDGGDSAAARDRQAAVGSGAAGSSASGGAAAGTAKVVGALEGRVLDAAGAPVPDATVHVDGDDAEPRVIAARADGTFAVPDLAPGSYAVVASAPGFLGTAVAAVAVTGGATARVDLTLTAGGNTVSGTVTDAGGGPVEGALVSAAPRDAMGEPRRVAAAALTDRDGRYKLTLAAGSYTLSGRRADYLGDRVAIEVAGVDLTVDLRLVPGGTVEGVVKDVATGAVVAGATVDAQTEPLGWLAGRGRVRAVTTDATGRFSLTGLPPGVLSLRARVDVDGRQSRDPLQVSLAIGEQAPDVELWIEAAPYLAGRVVDADGKPIADAQVSVLAGGNAEGTDTDADGRFRVLGVEPGNYRLVPRHPKYLPGQPLAVKVADRAITDLVLTMTSSPRIVGRVEPGTAATVTLDPMTDGPGDFMMMGAMQLGGTPTAADGTFVLTPVSPGHHVVSAKATDGRRGTVTVDVPAAGDAQAVIKLEERGSIAGTVRDQSGAPVAGVAVQLRPTGGAVERRVVVNGVDVSADRAITGKDGSFVMKGLDAGRYALSVLDERGGTLRWAGGRAAPTVELDLGEQKSGVALSVELDDGVIRGVVLDPTGAPKADAWVQAVPRPESLLPPPGEDGPRSQSVTQVVVMTDDGDSDAGATPPVLTDEQGRFELRRLRRGSYDVVAEAERGVLRGRTTNVATGGSTTVALTGLAAIAGVVTSGGTPVTDFTISMQGVTPRHQRVRAADGRFRIERLEPGEYTVDVQGEAGRGSAKTTVAAGATAEVAIAVVRDGTATGRLVDPSGQPIRGAHVLALPGDVGEHGSFTMSGPPEQSGADGRFSLTAAPGDYQLLVLQGGAPDRTGKTFTIVGGQQVDLGDVTVTPPSQPPAPPPPRGR